MASSLEDRISAATSIASLEEGVGVIILPVASNTFAGAGAEDWDAGVSRFAAPTDLRSVPATPVSSWTEFLSVLDEIWQSIDSKDLIEQVRINFVATHTMLRQPEQFRDGLITAYSDYIHDQAESLVNTIWYILEKLRLASACQNAILGTTAAALAHAVFDPDGTFDPQLILPQLVANPDCEFLRAAIIALGALRDAWQWLMDNGFDGIIEHVGTFATVLLEMLRDAKLQDRAAKLATDAFRLGVFYGSIIGFIVWEIIEDVLMAGLGKGLRLVKVIL